jgi:hypothetical protein
MLDHLRLAEICEAAAVPDRDVEIRIWKLNGGTCREGYKPLDWLHCSMSSIDAALTLAHADEKRDVMTEALSRLADAPAGRSEDYGQRLARFVTAAALRRMHRREVLSNPNFATAP